MAGLLRDRYFEYAPNHAWDLVTGEAVTSPATEDDDLPSTAASGAFIELLEHGREGMPRWIVADVTGAHWRLQSRLAALEARRRGYVAVGVNVFLRSHLLLADELRTRALVLIAPADVSMERLRIALLHAAAISPRPHLLMSMAPGNAKRAVARWHAAEARVLFGEAPSRAASKSAVSPDVRRLLDRASHAPELVRSGRHASAERLLREVAAALGRRQFGSQAAETYIALGELLLERGKAVAAEAAFGEAAGQAEGVDIDLVVTARIWQAAARTDAGQLIAAEALCRAVLATSPAGGHEQARAEATLGRVLIWQGRAAEACALPFVRDSSGPPFVASTGIRLLVEAGRIFEAGQRARELLDRIADSDPAVRVIGLAAHLRVLLAAGDLKLAEDQLRALSVAARLARQPLRLVRMRVEWSLALQRAGRTREAERELRALSRMRSALPGLLRSAIERAGRHSVAPPASGSSRPAMPPANAAELVTLAQRAPEDDDALQQIGEFVRRELSATRVEFWTADAGPATAVATAGAGLPTQLGERALNAGIMIGPEVVESGWEIGVPVRLGNQSVGALAVRWPADRSSPVESTSLLTLAAAVAAPRVDSFIHTSRQKAHASTAIPELVGVSAAIAEVRRMVVRAATAPFSVLIEGESGVGKELVARAIHHLGPRRDRRFCDVNCAALPDELFESELFGHARGAFTGAVSDRAGLIEEANGGTLFLDEVADLSSRAQAKLLRVVQQHEVRRVGETFSRKVDVRLVSAANRDLRVEGDEGRFRQDLRYRLDVIRIRIPPLRERPEDIPPLAHHFWALARSRMNTQATLTHGVLAALARYSWPGNVRELQNVMSALAVDAPVRGVVRASLLPAVITRATSVSSARFVSARTQWERRFIEVAMARAGGNRTRAARELGLSRQGLLKVLERLGIPTEKNSTSAEAG